MARQYFGTDGIRGLANTSPMTSEIALKSAWPPASSSPPARAGTAW
jgi:phosphomannomutase